jgi:hypothetical protein
MPRTKGYGSPACHYGQSNQSEVQQQLISVESNGSIVPTQQTHYTNTTMTHAVLAYLISAVAFLVAVLALGAAGQECVHLITISTSCTTKP